MKRQISRIISLLVSLFLISGSLPAACPEQIFRSSISPRRSSHIHFEQQAINSPPAFYGSALNHVPTVATVQILLGKFRDYWLPAQQVLPEKGLADNIRREFFIQNDGADVVTTVALLSRTGIMKLLQSRNEVLLSEVMDQLQIKHHRVNVGFVRIGLNLLAVLGWVTIGPGVDGQNLSYTLTEKGAFIAAHPGILAAYEKAAAFIKYELSTVEDIERGFPFVLQARPPPSSDEVTFKKWVREAALRDAFGLPDEDGRAGKILKEVKTQLWGTLLGPTAAIFEYNHLFDMFGDENKVSLEEIVDHVTTQSVFNGETDRGKIKTALSLFVAAGIMQRSPKWFGKRYALTTRGKAFVKLAAARGVPVSYLPMLAQLETLYFGDPLEVFAPDANGDERHVARAMNLLGTRAAHEQYFKILIPKIGALFDTEDYESQPQFAEDMGCGDGSLLLMLYEHIRKKTKRGKVLAKYPVALIGADYNRKARMLTEKNLSASGIKTFHVIYGDINDPAALTKELERLSLDPRAGVHMTTFLIHNRPFKKPSRPGGPGDYRTGTFVALDPDYEQHGYFVSNGDVDQNFREWLEPWKPLVARFGMFFTELHSVPWEIASEHIGDYAAASYKTTHDNSAQYIIPRPHFLSLMQEGMELVWMEGIPAKFAPNVPTGLYHFKTKSAAAVPAANLRDPLRRAA